VSSTRSLQARSVVRRPWRHQSLASRRPVSTASLSHSAYRKAQQDERTYPLGRNIKGVEARVSRQKCDKRPARRPMILRRPQGSPPAYPPSGEQHDIPPKASRGPGTLRRLFDRRREGHQVDDGLRLSECDSGPHAEFRL
jgi:hypothetical protein